MNDNPYYYPYNTYPSHAETPKWHLSGGASIAVLTILPITALVFTIVGFAIGLVVEQSRAKKFQLQEAVRTGVRRGLGASGQHRRRVRCLVT